MNSTDIESSVQQPTDKINAQEGHPIPRFSLINEIEYEIKNHPILEEVAKKYNTATENLPAPDTKEKNLLFAKLNIPDRIETDYGSEFFIDVHPLLHVYHCKRVSRPQRKRIPIHIALVYCYYLLCDFKLKAPRSKGAAPFKNDPSLNRFLNLVKSLPVPEDVKAVLNHVASVLDNQRQNLKFILTFAGFSFHHDFGYSIPISAFLRIHNIFATCKSSSDPEITMTRISNCPLINITNVNYTIGHLFGGSFAKEQSNFIRRNWLNIALEAFVNALVSRSLL